MAANTHQYQMKRTSVSGRLANTTDSSNNAYIPAGGLSVNFADKIVYTSNGSSLLEVGSHLTDLSVANSITVGGISLNVTSFPGTANNALYLNGQNSSFYTNATNINTGTLGVGILANSGVVANLYGNSSSIPIITVDSKGRITNATTTAVAGVTGFSYTSSNSTFSLTTGDGSTYIATITEANATTSGIVQIIDSVSNTSSVVAASANSVKAAYDLASQAIANVFTAYTNAVSYTDTVVANVNTAITGNAASAYSNAVSVANTNAINLAANAYSNAISYADTKSATAYSNAIATAATDATSKAATAYSNSTSYADTKAATAYSNAVSVANTNATSLAGNAYSNAIVFAANASNINTGTLSAARLPFTLNQNVGTTDSPTFQNLSLSGNLNVSGSVTTIGGNNLSITDNMLYLNNGVLANISSLTANGSQIVFSSNNNFSAGWSVSVYEVNPSQFNNTYVIFAANSSTFTVNSTSTGSYISGGNARGKSDVNPDLGFAAGYNDGTYHHAGFFRDHTTGIWKVFDGYLPEPDASIDIDQSNSTFQIANFMANTYYIGNNTLYATVNSSIYTGTANNSNNLGGVSLSTVQGYITSNASAAYSNSVSNTTYQSGVAYSNAVATASSDATSKAATAYTNATSYADTKAATAYSNATSYTDTKAATAYSNATAYADTKAATAYSNATSYADTKAASAYSNAVANAAALYQTTAGLSANVATLTANAATYLGNSSGTISNVVSWITGNSAVAYSNAISTAATDASSKAATAYTNAVNYTSNGITNGAIVAANATYSSNSGLLGGSSLSTIQSQITGNSSTAYTNAIAFAANASTINSGSIGVSYLPANLVFWSNNNTFTGTQTFGNVTIGINQARINFTANSSASGNLSYFTLQADNNFVFYNTATDGTARAIFASYTNSNTSPFNVVVPLKVSSSLQDGTGSNGTSGYVLTSNGTGVNWTAPSSGSFSNGTAYIWSAVQTYTANIVANTTGTVLQLGNSTVAVAISANGSNGSSGQVLTSNGTSTYWATASAGSSGLQDVFMLMGA